MFGSQRQMSIWIAVIVTEQQSTYAARGQPRVVQLQPLHADSCSARLQCSTNQWSDCASLPAAKPLGAPGGGLCYHYKYFEPTLQGLSGLLKPEILGIPPDLNPPPNSNILLLYQMLQDTSSFFYGCKRDPCTSVKQYHLPALHIISSTFSSMPDIAFQKLIQFVNLWHCCPTFHMQPWLLAGFEGCLVCHAPLHCWGRSCHRRLEPCRYLICFRLLF